MFSVNKNPSVSDLRFFAWSMLLGFNGVSATIVVVLWWRFGTFESLWETRTLPVIGAILLALAGTVSGLLSLLSIGLARRSYILWMSATVPVGIVMSTVMLTVLFVILLPVFSLIVRMGDPLRKKLGASSYWENYKPHEATLERMRRLF